MRKLENMDPQAAVPADKIGDRAEGDYALAQQHFQAEPVFRAEGRNSGEWTGDQSLVQYLHWSKRV